MLDDHSTEDEDDGHLPYAHTSSSHMYLVRRDGRGVDRVARLKEGAENDPSVPDSEIKFE